MESVEALRSSARRYVLDRWDEWVERYQELNAREARARQEAGVPEAATYAYSDEARAIYPRYQLLRVIDVDLQELALADVPSLDAARELFVASAASSLETELGRISGEIAERVMQEEWALFADYVRSVSEEELATVEPLRTVFGGPTSSLGEELSPEISALIVWQENDDGGAARDWICATLDAAGVKYSATFPGVCSIRLDKASDYDPLRELLEDAGMDAEDSGTWPASGILYIPPYRHVS